MNKLPKMLSTRREAYNALGGITKILNKKAYSKDGETLGRVSQVIINKYEVEGIIITKAFFFSKLFVDKEYVDKFSTEGVVLKVNPIMSMLGKIVFDKEGRIIGKVKSVNRKSNSNTFQSITVKKGLFGRERTILPQDISMIKKNVILKISL